MNCRELIAQVDMEVTRLRGLAQSAKHLFLSSSPSSKDHRRAHRLWLSLQGIHDTTAGIVSSAEYRKGWKTKRPLNPAAGGRK